MRLARENALLAFDYDGTLAALVDDPQTAVLAEPTRLLLFALAAHRRCAVLSGRALDDLRARLAGLPHMALVGNHGLEVDGVPPPEEQARRMRALRAQVAEFNVYRWAGRLVHDAAGLRRAERRGTRLAGVEGSVA